MQTKKTPTRSDVEILKDMEELAKEHARTGEFQSHDDKRFAKLIDEYVSSVSPDREGLLKKETNDSDIMSNIIARGNNIAENGNANNNIIATRNDGYYTAVDYDRGDGKVTTLVYDNQGNKMPWMTIKSDMYDINVMNGVVDNGFFRDENGDTIASYHNNKLYQQYTKSENERMQEIVGTYNAAFDVAYRRLKNNNNGTSTMDKAYNSTYERLRSESGVSGFRQLKSKVSGANFGNVLLPIFIGNLLLGVSIYLDGSFRKKNTEICILQTYVDGFSPSKTSLSPSLYQTSPLG
jgi:hypothetical protein